MGSCPDLAAVPYTGQQLQQQLQQQMRDWLSNRQKGAEVLRSSNTLRLSKIFYWYTHHFTQDHCPPREEHLSAECVARLVEYLMPYLPEDDAQFIRQQQQIKVTFMEYSWLLNDGRQQPSNTGQTAALATEAIAAIAAGSVVAVLCCVGCIWCLKCHRKRAKQ